MKTHTQNFKSNIKKFGRQIDAKITYTIDNEEIELGKEQLNSVSPHYEGKILKSVMKQLDLDSNVDIPLNTVLNAQFGVKVNGTYEYINFGDYVVYKSEKQEDTNSYIITCYDMMLYSMTPYENLGITYPISVKNYINACVTHLGLTFANINDNFTNASEMILAEPYLDADGKSLDYQFRDVFDELSAVVAGNICINDDNEVEIRYIANTNDTIDEEFLKDVNVKFGDKFGAVNTIVLSRSAGADNVYYPSPLPARPYELKISDNQIMNGNDRAKFLPGIYQRLNGLEFYINDFSSPGICYYDLCDRYTVSIGGNTYSCVMFNDEINITQGLEENIYTDLPQETVTDYSKADKTDRKINQTNLIVDKQNQTIEALASRVIDVSATVDGIDEITLQNAYAGTLHRLEITGNLEMIYPSDDLYPADDLYPLDTYLFVDNEKYHLDIDILRYMSSTVCDKYIYEDGKQRIERHVGVDGQGNLYELTTPTIENRVDLVIEVDSSSTIYLESFRDMHYKCIYLLQNEYTDSFVPTVDAIAKLNLSPGEAKLLANKIALEGYTTINGNFSVDLNGNMSCNNANINGELVTKNGVLTNLQFPCETWGWNRTNVYDYQGGGPIGFNFNEDFALGTIVVHKSFLNFTVRIPEHFIVKSAKIYLKHTPITWWNADGNDNRSGSCKNINAYVISNLGMNADAEYFGGVDIGGNTPFTTQINQISSHSFNSSFFEEYTTENFKDIFSTAGTYNIALMTTTSTPTLNDSDDAYQVLGPHTGILNGILEVIGYTSNV